MTKVSSVSLHRVGHAFGGMVVLRGLTGRFEPGVIHLLLGANGSGKTTLLRIVSTMLRPTFGEVSYEGVDPSCIRSCLGWVSHEALVYPDLSGEQNLRLAAGLRGLPEDGALEKVRERFSLGKWVTRPVRSLSRGQRQRIALARGFIHEPSLLLLDEPTTGLDKEGVLVLTSLVREQTEAGHVVLVVTHDPAPFCEAKHRIWTLERGYWKK